MRRLIALALAAFAAFAVTAPARADGPDLIFKESTTFKWVTPNDKIAIYGVDDPDIDGVACHFAAPEKGGVSGMFGVAEETSDISLACRQVGPVTFKNKIGQGDEMFRQRRSFWFKNIHFVVGSRG